MIWQYSPYLIPCITCGFILAILGITGWFNRSCICARSYSILMIAGSIWAFCTALELSSADIQTQMLAILIEYPAMAIIPVAWLLFAFEYIGKDDWITRKNIALLCIIPIITVIAVATNEIHHLFYSTVSERIIGGFSFHIVTYGPAFWLHAVYSYTLICLTILLILQRFIFSSPVYRRQVITILIATLIPLVANLVLVFRLGPVGLIDPTPFALVISGFIILFGMIRFQLFDISPVVNEQILENMSDGIIVVDTENRIINLNSPAARFLDLPFEKALGTILTDVLSCPAPRLPISNNVHAPVEEIHDIERELDGKKEYFELRYVPLRTRSNEIKGRVILVRNITNQNQTEMALAAAREKLNLLSSFTRHDILNQVTALLLNIEIAQEEKSDPAIREWLKKQEIAVLNIQHQIEFARDYESLGVSPPQWININRTYDSLRPIMASHGISLEIMQDEIEVFGDPLIERVSFNLIDNSIQHGAHVTKIRVSHEETKDGLTLIHEDNGIGIPDSDKERIFQRGIGRDNGLGLFLIWEILAITGITIRECGVPEKGARFEVHIPQGQYRVRQKPES
ncbi:histidine kinase N-terminal 7TM domain-containing protein [uncultured Methanoregula sp.]|uniref:histidine kinase N-terminal 7TM domain-containing protein n=1 Tax=uncultured Methanoregula sp. TaxID=1005933 RepID=UPI002AAADFE3|nr:histidine kinase N-terminal 7TM domain-containing protein [uncultured Methanoregula sp.]